MLVGCICRNQKVYSKMCCCSVAKPCPTLSNPMDCSTLGFPGLHHLRVCPSSCPLNRWCYPTLSSSSLSTISLSQHQGLFWWVSSSHQVAKIWSFSFSISPSSEYSALISFRMYWLDLLAVQGTQESSPAPQFETIDSSALSLLYGPTHICTWLLGKT